VWLALLLVILINRWIVYVYYLKSAKAQTVKSLWLKKTKMPEISLYFVKSILSSFFHFMFYPNLFIISKSISLLLAIGYVFVAEYALRSVSERTLTYAVCFNKVELHTLRLKTPHFYLVSWG